jgi:tRNA(fMet)-specific endonuclease VapC
MTRYEVVRGLKAKKATRQFQKFAIFCQHCLIVGIDDTVLDRAAELWVSARQGGFPKKDADLIIAATALQKRRTLVTGNTNHFSWVPGLAVEDWRQP